jgi:hypothetical protein
MHNAEMAEARRIVLGMLNFVLEKHSAPVV